MFLRGDSVAETAPRGLCWKRKSEMRTNPVFMRRGRQQGLNSHHSCSPCGRSPAAPRLPLVPASLPGVLGPRRSYGAMARTLALRSWDQGRICTWGPQISHFTSQPFHFSLKTNGDTNSMKQTRRGKYAIINYAQRGTTGVPFRPISSLMRPF